MTVLGDKLQEAINDKRTDITSFVWKGLKTLDKDGVYRQEEKTLVSMNAYELNKCYSHCKTMLNNSDTKNPGRYLVLDIINEQKNKCGIELFIRYAEDVGNSSRFNLMETLAAFLNANKKVFVDGRIPLVEDAFDDIPNEFKKLNLNLIIDGCLDKLGVFNKKHLTRTFILKQGIWLTSSESKEILGDKDPSERLQLIREHLNIKDVERLYVNPKGVNYTQMRALLNIKMNKKYSDLTTDQLKTLRNRLLFSLENDVKKHISSWERRMEEIELVSEHNGIPLD